MNSNPVFSRFYLPIHATFQNKHEIHHKKNKAISSLKFVLLIMTKKERKNHPEL